MYEATKILIDDREMNSANYKRGLKRYYDIPSDIERLHHGDFFWNVSSTDDPSEVYAVTVERKTNSDFINSARDGRLERFASWVPDSSVDGSAQALKFILLEGANKKILRAGFNNGWSTEAVDNALLEAQMRGIYVVHCGGGEVVKRLASLYNWLLKDNHSTMVRINKLQSVGGGGHSDSTKRKLRFLMAFSGIGEQTALAILQHYGGEQASLSDILYEITEHDGAGLLQVRGVGQRTVENMKEFLK